MDMARQEKLHFFTIYYTADKYESMNWTLVVCKLPAVHDGLATATALSQMMQACMWVKAFAHLLRDGGLQYG